MARSQVELNKEYRDRMTPEQRAAFYNRKRYSMAKSYIRLHATNEQLREVKQIIDDRLKPWSTINTKREKG